MGHYVAECRPDALHAGGNVRAQHLGTRRDDSIPLTQRGEAADEDRDVSSLDHRRKFLRDDTIRRRERGRQHDGIAPRATRGERQLFERRLRGKHHDTQSTLVRGQRENQQAQFVLFIGQAGREDARTRARAGAVMKPRAQLVAHVHREEVFLGDTALA